MYLHKKTFDKVPTGEGVSKNGKEMPTTLMDVPLDKLKKMQQGLLCTLGILEKYYMKPMKPRLRFFKETTGTHSFEFITQALSWSSFNILMKRERFHTF